jgi:hypothetical protein
MDTVGSFVGTMTGTMSGGTQSGGGGDCGGEAYTGEKQPLAMMIMLDKSGSMNDSTGAGTKWQAVTTALQAYINAPTSAGVEVGIAYFGVPVGGGPACPTACGAQCIACGGTCLLGIQCLPAGGGGNSCNLADYSTPVVPIALLPGNATALINSINSVAPGGGTPTSISLEGGIVAARNYAMANPNKKVIHTYVTDGDPTECNTDFNAIYAIAAAGVNGTPSIQTYVIGVGPSLTALQGIAMAGGSGMPFLVDSSPQATQQFIDAMNTIQGNALTCTFTIPTPTSGTLDPTLVNVEYTPSGGGTPQNIGHVDSQASCPAGGMAWYYDNNTTPTQIILCPDTCSVVTMDVTGSIRIVLGCPSKPPT